VTTTIHVRALLAGDDDWLLDCTLCGVLGVTHGEHTVNQTCLQHLEDHGIDTHGIHTTRIEE